MAKLKYIKSQPPITHCMFLTEPDLKVIRKTLKYYADYYGGTLTEQHVLRIVALIDESLKPEVKKESVNGDN